MFLGVAILFLANVETRMKRRRALAALHELRSIAHIVDMHPVLLDAVNDVETLTTGLSRKIGQKVMIIDTLEPSRRLT